MMRPLCSKIISIRKYMEKQREGDGNAYRMYATILRQLLMWRLETALNGSVAEPSVPRGDGRHSAKKDKKGDAPMHLYLFITHAGGVDDAGALFGACHLRNECIVSIHAYSYLREEGRRKEEEGEKGQRKEKRRKNPPADPRS
jgi:hypothetical protein